MSPTKKEAGGLRLIGLEFLLEEANRIGSEHLPEDYSVSVGDTHQFRTGKEEKPRIASFVMDPLTDKLTYHGVLHFNLSALPPDSSGRGQSVQSAAYFGADLITDLVGNLGFPNVVEDPFQERFRELLREIIVSNDISTMNDPGEVIRLEYSVDPHGIFLDIYCPHTRERQKDKGLRNARLTDLKKDGYQTQRYTNSATFFQVLSGNLAEGYSSPNNPEIIKKVLQKLSTAIAASEILIARNNYSAAGRMLGGYLDRQEEILRSPDAVLTSEVVLYMDALKQHVLNLACAYGALESFQDTAKLKKESGEPFNIHAYNDQITETYAIMDDCASEIMLLKGYLRDVAGIKEDELTVPFSTNTLSPHERIGHHSDNTN